MSAIIPTLKENVPIDFDVWVTVNKAPLGDNYLLDFFKQCPFHCPYVGGTYIDISSSGVISCNLKSGKDINIRQDGSIDYTGTGGGGGGGTYEYPFTSIPQNGNLVININQVPVSIVTDTGGVYSLLDGTVTLVNGVVTIAMPRNLAAIGVTGITGTWKIRFSGGAGAKGDPGTNGTNYTETVASSDTIVTNSYNADFLVYTMQRIKLTAGAECELTASNVPLGRAVLVRIDNASAGSLTWNGATIISTAMTGVYVVCLGNYTGTIARYSTYMEN